jgi:hypothetical protein
LCAFMLLTTVPTHAAATPAPYVFIEEDVEEPTFEEWHVRWNKFDANDGSSQDFWCRQVHEYHTGISPGTHAAWCARSGYNTHYLTNGVHPMNVNITALNPYSGANATLRYDTNQDSIMRKELVGANYYETITLTFWFYSDTGRSDAKQPDTGALVGYDFLNVIYYTGTNNNMVKHILWTDTMEEAFAKTWNEKTLQVPNDAIWIGFEFVSGSTPPLNGDAPDALSAFGVRTDPDGSRGMKEGAFVDDIKVVGTDSSDPSSMVTSLDDLLAYQASSTFPVTYTDNDPAANMIWVNLYYRLNGTDEWTRYTTGNNPQGAFISSPIMFTAPTDGVYEFVTQGKDPDGALEAWRGVPDTSTTVDTASPSSVVNLSGKGQGGSYSGAARVTMSGTDTTSGIKNIMYRIDGGEWKQYTGPISLVTTGTHLVEYYAQDLAGNDESVRTISVTVVDGATGIIFESEDNHFENGTAAIAFTVGITSTLSKLEYSLDGGAFQPLDLNATSVEMTGLTDGEHDLTIRATDSDSKAVEGTTTFTVGSVSEADSSDDIVSNPLAWAGIGLAGIAVVGGVVYGVRRKKK